MRALLADQQVAVDGLRRRFEILRSEISDKGRGKGGTALPNDVAQRVSDLEARLALLEQGRPAELGRPVEAGSLPSPLEIGGAPQVLPSPLAPRPQNPQEIAIARDEAALQGAKTDGDYRDALQLIRQGQCSQAVPKLRDFIRKNAKSDFADNAQYFIGSCYYSQRDYNRAIIELNEVLLKYPKGDKVPAALIMLADAFADSGDKIDARLILQKLISDHPRSEEAERARRKLQSLAE